MFGALWLVPAVPALGFLILAIAGPRLPRAVAGAIGVGTIGLSAVVAIAIGASFIASPPPGDRFTLVVWTWMNVGGFTPRIAFYLDALSIVMTVVVTFVSFFIHLYSVEFVWGDEGFSRFFAYMNLFVASMVTLVLADNLLLLYLGWEGVGLCSYLLIGFWYTDPVNGRAARKAFIVTRVGDTAMAIGLFLLFTELGTLDIQPLMAAAQSQWGMGSMYAAAAAALLLGGAVGKSAQLPLQTWLPDAMAGPTPTSALIHAATMVTAGVYLIARTHVLYTLAPAVQFLVALVGIITLLMAGFSALTQTDIKRVLAYSTISQIGYMFLALGVGAWAAAIFHFMTHAFFKALLFLAAGIVIEALHREHDIFRMGGLRTRLPIAFWTFLIGGCALAGLPIVTAGFYSKDLILFGTAASPAGSVGLWIAGMIGVVLTSLYTFRLIFVVFLGEPRTPVSHPPGILMALPVIVLSAFSIAAGWINLPPSLGNRPVFTELVETALPRMAEGARAAISEGASSLVAALAFLIGLVLAYALYVRKRAIVEALAANPVGGPLRRWWFADWGMDWLYDRLFVRPIVWIAHVDRHDIVDTGITGIARTAEAGHAALSATETGRLRWYGAGIAAGTIVFVAIVLFL